MTRGRRRLWTILLVYAGILVVLGFLGSCVRRTDGATGQVKDGLGRALVPSPEWTRPVFDQSDMWAGWSWFSAEMAIYGITLLIIYAMKITRP